jgi:DNA-binding response OmpR family regulator
MLTNANANENRIRVLVVDDDQEQLSLVKRTLSSYGFEVHTHTTSLGVSRLVRSETPDLVLMDVHLPALNGDKVLAVARTQANLKTKFILYSASDETRLRTLALRSGADGYLTKSLQGEALARKLVSMHGKEAAQPTLLT